jgi:hypothetical protein
MMIRARRRSFAVAGLCCVLCLPATLSFGTPVDQQVEGTYAAGDVEEAKALVTARLLELGLSPAEAQARVDALEVQDLQQLAANPEQLAMGGMEDKTLVLIIVAGAVAIVAFRFLLWSTLFV